MGSLFVFCFQRKEVRLLICTDVAARGIDIHGVPHGKQHPPSKVLCVPHHTRKWNLNLFSLSSSLLSVSIH